MSDEMLQTPFGPETLRHQASSVQNVYETTPILFEQPWPNSSRASQRK